MRASACWQRLDLPGHDAALLLPGDTGWSLQGCAVFGDPAGPACIRYSLDVDTAWRTRRGRVQGFAGRQTFDHDIRRQVDGWYLDDRPVTGLKALFDLDYGFTPATNLQQLRRARLDVGQAIDLPVVWFDIGQRTLVELPQRYERLSANTYRYASPSAHYEGVLELAEDGFVRHYPGLWAMQD
ncbi:MAG: putative glycolipid-binding domain-containing protein [Solimonas sp.]